MCRFAAAAVFFLFASPAQAQFVEDTPQLFSHRAIRCGECHEKMVKEWRTSAHARSVSDPLYARLAEASKSPTCTRCHAPLATTAAKDTPAAQEGVTCIVCHTIKETLPGSGSLTLRLQDNTMYAPICDAKQHYFHKMGCSPLHSESKFCGGCHLYYADNGGNRLPVYTEYEDWEKSQAKIDKASCQSCHMPTMIGQAAKEGPQRNVGHHGLWDIDRRMRKKGITVVITHLSSDAQSVEMHVVMQNDAAGHSLPAGDPLHKLVLVAESYDDVGHSIDRSESVYGRTLVDPQGKEVPFYAAERLASDTRLASGETRDIPIKLRTAAVGSLHVSLAFRTVSRDIAKENGVTPPEDLVLAEVQLPLRAVKAGHRKIPATIKAKTPP